MPAFKKVKLVNRGPAGLLSKVPDGNGQQDPVVEPGKKNRIRCKGDVVDLDTLRLDPNNARLHPERNLGLIRDSLNLYGQMKPLVVRKRGRVVVAGNGTLEAAKALGWTKLAASFVELSDVEAAGYGMADNRTAEFARWDFEVVARLDKLIQDAGAVNVGWTLDELTVLRGNMEEYQPIQGNDNGDQSWQDLWKGMPEFEQEDLTGAKSLVVHFRTEDDYLAFLKLVKQVPGDVRQRSIWHPKAEIGRFADKRYVSKLGKNEGKQ